MSPSPQLLLVAADGHGMNSPSAVAGHDPYGRRISTPLVLDRLVAALALIWGLAYLGWRVTDSLIGVSPLLGIPLVAAEIAVWLSFGSFLHLTWRRRSRQSPEPLDLGSVDVFVTSLNDPVDAVRATLIGCHALDVAHTLWVLDDGHRIEIEALAAEHGAEYVARTAVTGARAGNLNHGMSLSEADFAVFLSAGEVPLPDFFRHTSGLFADDRVAAVVAGTTERNADRSAPRMIEHIESEVTAPSLDRVDAAAWEGGPLVVRRRAHDAVGGLPCDTVAPDLGYTLRLWQGGWIVRMVPTVLAELPGPANLTARLALRDRRVLGRVEALRGPGSALTRPGLTLHQRASRLEVLASASASAARLLVIVVAGAVMITGALPIAIGSSEAIALLAPAFALRALAVWLLSDGRIRPLANVEHELSYLGLHLRALWAWVTGKRAVYRFAPRSGLDPHPLEMLSKVPMLAPLSTALWITVAFRVAVLAATGSNDRSLWVSVAAAGAIASLCTGETLRWARHRERRTYGRLPVEVSGRLDGNIVRVLDVVGDGIGIETGRPLELNSTTIVSLHLPDPTGALHDLRLTARVRWVADLGEGVHRAGLEFVDLRAIERDRLVEFASVTVPFRRIDRRTTAAS